MLQEYLVSPIAKLDIKDLLEPNHSPPPPQSIQPSSFTRSISVPSSNSRCDALPSPSSTSSISHYSAATAPLNAYIQQQPQKSSPLPAQPRQLSITANILLQQNTGHDPISESAVCSKRPLPADEDSVCLPAKKQSKWKPEEDTKVLNLRAQGMKWEDISKQLLGRSPTSCRLHYQNYLERRSSWDEEKKNKLARVYDRFKSKMWNDVATELGVPWRAAEAMHWSLGEQEMARRANVTPFYIHAARSDRHDTGSGRVAQRDRMLESTRVFEGQDLNTLSSPFNGVNGNGLAHQYTPAGFPYSVTSPAAHMHIAPIKNENDYDGNDDDGDLHSDDENKDGIRTHKRRSGTGPRLPSLAAMDGEVQAIAERERRGLMKGDRFEGRRGSSGSSGSSSSSTRSGGSR